MVLQWRLGARSRAVCALFCVLNGCSDGPSQELLDQANRSVVTALDTWKRGEQAATLQSAQHAIEFHDDDWDRSAKLVEYQLIKTYVDTDGTPRCAVALTVEHDGRDRESVQVTYQIVKKENRTVIARDPMS